MNKYEVYTDSLTPFRIEADDFINMDGDYMFFKNAANTSDSTGSSEQAFVALVKHPLVILKLNS